MHCRYARLSLLSASLGLIACGGERDLDVHERVGSHEAALSIASVLDVGHDHGAVALSDGTVYTWGYNGYGQLGDGTTTTRSTPVQITGLSDIVDVSGGWQHSCAVDDSGDVYCWGTNGYGKLGDGTTTNSYSPTAAWGVSSAIDVTASAQNTCVVLSSGSVQCWGSNLVGQLGNGSNVNNSTTAVTVSSLSDAVAIESGNGSSFHCALRSTGGVACWGQNAAGQLGDGTTQNRYAPVDVTGISSAVAIAVGTAHACALLSDGTIKCWGSNGHGRLGTGSLSPGYSATPVSVSGISDAVAISAGTFHTCAIHTDGTMSCWGSNANYQLGDGTTTDRSSPVAVSGISDAVQVSAGYLYTCASIAGGGVKCWGNDASGQLGDGSSGGSSSTPVDVALP